MKKLIGSILLGAGIIFANLLHAQTELSETNVDWSSASDLEVELNAIEMTTPTPATDVPQLGTFWSAQHAPGSPDAWPPLPGNVNHAPAWNLGDGVFLLSDENFDYDAVVKTTLKARRSMSALDLSPGGGGAEEDDLFSPSFSFASSTNLWLAITNLASHTAGLVLSNTLADISYEIQGNTNLTSTNWISYGFVLGSELTNWTPTSVTVTNYPNLFLRVRSWQDDGSGLPIWWQLQYFGHIGVDPYGDPDGDGWNNLQEFQNGTNPNSFNTPPTPQGLTVTYNSGTETANISWLPSSGAVISYTVQRINDGTTTNFTIAGTNFEDNLSAWVANNGYYPNQALWENFVSYDIQANYADGTSSLSVRVQLAPAVSAVLVPGQQGSGVLAVSSMPANTVALQLFGRDAFLDYSSNTSHDTNIYFSVNTNGLYPVANQRAQPDSGFGSPVYAWYVQAISSNGSTSAVVKVSDNFSYNGDFFNAIYSAWTYSWMLPPYYDGRTQLKDNIRFLLRAATVSAPFHYAINGYDIPAITNSPDYVYSGFFNGALVDNSLGFPIVSFDPLEPIEDNRQYDNFVFNPAQLDDNGRITNGLSGDYSSIYQGLYWPNAVYQFPYPTNNNVTFSSLLATNATRWLCTYPFDSPEEYFDGSTFVSYGYLEEIGVTPSVETDWETYYNTYETMAGNARNVYGLQFLSAKIAWGNTSGTMTTLSAGSAVENVDGYFYPEVAQPQFQNVEYDFWGGTYYGYFANYYAMQSPLPGMTNFSTSQASGLLVAPVGAPGFQVVGYAKLAVTNGYSGVYGYLAQYFDKAYQMTNGIVTTNQTGVLSPYGNFFATQPGAVALVTMPDVDTGARGTTTVYCVSLNVDANHDGNMDLSFSGADATSANNPAQIWANNNYDRGHTVDGSDFEQDDLGPVDIANGHLVPDCQYTTNGLQAISCTRDLEDYFRLWMSGVANLMKALPGNYSVQLTLSGSGAIRIFQAIEPNGGTNYLFDETTASNQVASSPSLYIGLLTSSSPIVFNLTTNFNEHFIFCGAQLGSAQIDLQVLDNNGNVVADSPAYLQINDIKQMYERWTVGENPNLAPATVATHEVDNMAFQYTPPQDTNTPYILFVHGWNMETWEKDRYAETAFKRLYWQGYHGRFGSFRWPTGNKFSGIISALLDARNYDNSESNAWASSIGLLNKLNDLNAEYSNHVYLIAHSMGNVVAGEALRLAGTNQVVNTYVAMQGAVPAHCYDGSTANNRTPSPPDEYAHYWTTGATSYFASSTGAGTYVNFYNTNDYALGWWNVDQGDKPDNATTPAYHYVTPSGTHPSGFYKQFGPTDIDLSFPANTYELFAYGDPSWSFALGAQADVGGVFKTLTYHQVDLFAAPYSFGSAHKGHSAQFRSDNMSRSVFWNTLINQMFP